ncbi:MAG: tRNA (adenosine(37)-N6)-threonylcarbamoyltransferase complex dimerization subunit type 1 TsaB [Syntrophaceae bacterium]|nr:tRNA (adenosine(37)-N6)-threonylcarbamoyltransferase complex dimerization subunit type 1 TsaB [Syntrophaceae bacterium]
MITLAIDTATRAAGVALLRDERVLAEYFFELSVHHSETVLPALQWGLRLAGIGIGDVDLIALTMGPGSFTGLRIGASTVKGLALATGTPVVGVSTLEALAYNAAGFTGLVCPLLDARKGEVYGALYRSDGQGLLEAVAEERVGAPAGIVARADGDTLFLGDGLAAAAACIAARPVGLSHFLPPNLQAVRPSSVALLGRRSRQRGETLDPVTFVPRYLRRSEAEIRFGGKP